MSEFKPQEAVALFVTDVRVLSDPNQYQLNKQIQVLIAAGWTIQGPLHVSDQLGFTIMLVKYDPRIKTMVEGAMAMLETQLAELKRFS